MFSFVLCFVVDVVRFILLSLPTPECSRKLVGYLGGFDAFFDAHALWVVLLKSF